MSTEPQRTCPTCGNELSGAMEFCPVCMLRKGLAGGVESGESSLEDSVKPTPEQAVQRFEHYELVKSFAVLVERAVKGRPFPINEPEQRLCQLSAKSTYARAEFAD